MHVLFSILYNQQIYYDILFIINSFSDLPILKINYEKIKLENEKF